MREIKRYKNTHYIIVYGLQYNFNIDIKIEFGFKYRYFAPTDPSVIKNVLVNR